MTTATTATTDDDLTFAREWASIVADIRSHASTATILRNLEILDDTHPNALELTFPCADCDAEVGAPCMRRNGARPPTPLADGAVHEPRRVDADITRDEAAELLAGLFVEPCPVCGALVPENQRDPDTGDLYCSEGCRDDAAHAREERRNAAIRHADADGVDRLGVYRHRPTRLADMLPFRVPPPPDGEWAAMLTESEHDDTGGNAS
jgi:hypothetical protein